MFIRLPSGIMADNRTGTRRTTRALLRRFLWPTPLVVLPELGLLVSTDMLLHSPDREAPLDCPTRCHQAHRRDGRTKDKAKVQVPIGVSSRNEQEVSPGQEKYGWKENAETAVFSH
jgi:hypothetical protein